VLLVVLLVVTRSIIFCLSFSRTRSVTGCVTGRLVELQVSQSGVTDQGLMSLVNDSSTASNLRKLSISKCLHVTNRSIGRLAMSEQFINLTDLSLTGCSQLDDFALDRIAVGFPRSRDT